MTTDPGVPVPDVMAVERFRSVLTDVTDAAFGAGDRIRLMLEAFPSAQFVQDVNAAGVPVRRLVVHGEWEVDPNPPAVPQVERGDVVHYVDREFGEHDDWTVMAVPVSAANPGDSLVLLTRAEWDEGAYVNTAARNVRIVSRPNA